MYFDGSEDPLAADEWMRNMEDNLHLSKYDRAGWVDLVKSQLKENARSWWDAAEELLVQPVSWATFKTRFYAEYFPKAGRRELRDKFMNLKQDGRPVEKYHLEFYRLCGFGSELVKDPEDRAEKFLKGMDIRLKGKMTTTDMESYEKLLIAAKR